MRVLVENDAAAALKGAQHLHDTIPAGAAPADEALALNLVSRAELYLALTGPAADHAKQAYEIARRAGDPIGQAEADLNTALNSVNQGRIDELVASTTHSLTVLEGVPRPSLLGESLLRTAMMYRRLGQIEESVAMTMQAMEIARRGNDPMALAYAYQGLAISYDQSHHQQESLENYRQMLSYARAAKSKLLEGDALIGVATSTNNLGDPKRAEPLVEQAIALYREVHAPFYVNKGLFTLADIRRSVGRYAEAAETLAEVIAIYQKYPNSVGLYYSYGARSAIYQSEGKLNAANADAQRAVALADQIGIAPYRSDATRRLAAVAAALGDSKRAYELLSAAEKITAEAARDKSSQQMVELAKRYESESARRQLEELARRNEQQAAELRQRELQQRWLWTLLIGVAAALAITGFFLLRLHRARRALEAAHGNLQRSQESLRRQTDILESILNSMGDGVSVADAEGQLLLVNPAGRRIVGVGGPRVPAGEWSARYGLYLPDRVTPYPENDLPLARAMRGESCDKVEIFVRNADAPAGRWVIVTARPLTDKQGVAHGGVAVYSDVTVHKQAEAEIRALNVTLEQRVLARTDELRQQARYLRTLIDMLPMWAWFKDTQKRYLVANQSHAEACGRTVDEMIGKSDLDLLPRSLAESHHADDAEVMASRQRKTVEEPVAAAEGTVWMETYKAAVVDEDGSVLGTVGVARNISERKAVEQAREQALTEARRLARTRSEFLAQMSHELRTPLNGILGFAEILLLDKHLSEQQTKGLNVIRSSGQHLLTLINDILDLARIDAAKMELAPTEVAVADFLASVTDIVRVKAEEKRLAFSFHAGARLPAAVRVDEKRLRQVLLNLLSNAVKFTDHGHVALRVQALPALACDDPDDGRARSTGTRARLRFEVEDSGIGMTDAQLARLFRPFEQVGDARHREGGAGLGLVITRQLVQLMGGELQVHTRAGVGSVFWFEIELPVADARKADAASAPGHAIGYHGPRKHILVVDDVSPNLAMLADGLAALGFEVSQAVNGQDAIDRVKRERPDLVVMDIMMPIMDGLEATRRIHATPGFEHLPVIATSASASPGIDAICRAAGVQQFLPKPIERELLLDALARLLALRWIYEASGDPAAPH